MIPLPSLTATARYALYHNLTQQIRAGTTKNLPRKFSTVYFVGNSYGSVIGLNIAHQFPKDYDQFVLTGFSKLFLPSLPGVSLQGPVPAAVENPARFGTLAPGYLTSPVEQTRTDSFFGSHAQAAYDDAVSHQFWVREDVVSVGQFISTYADFPPAPEYKGRVLVLTGEHDQAVCGPGSPKIGPANCGPLLQQTGTLFPNAQYNWKSIPQTGHAVPLHNTSVLSFFWAATFLAGETYHG